MTDHCSSHRETHADDSPRGERYLDDRTALANVYDGASLRAILFDDREVARYRETTLTVILTPAGQCRVDGACPGVQRGDGVETDGGEVVQARVSEDQSRNDVACRCISTRPLTKWTFENTTIREEVGSWLRGRVLNACCGMSILEHPGEVVRNDMDTGIDADFHLDVAALPIHLDPGSFDVIVFDPPWTVYQANLVYDGRHVRRGETDIDTEEQPFHVPRETSQIGHARLAKEGFDYLLKDGGHVVQLTSHGTCMPSRLGYEREERVVFDPYGEAKAVIMSVDRKVQSKLPIGRTDTDQETHQ